MDTQMIMDAKAKRNMGLLCFFPAVAFLICLLYYLFILSPLITNRQLEDHTAIAAYTSRNYDTLFIMLAISAIISAVVLIYCLVHLTRLKNVNAPTKVVWILVLSALVPVSFILFWLLHVRNEPQVMDVYSDIT